MPLVETFSDPPNSIELLGPFLGGSMKHDLPASPIIVLPVDPEPPSEPSSSTLVTPVTSQPPTPNLGPSNPISSTSMPGTTPVSTSPQHDSSLSATELHVLPDQPAELAPPLRRSTKTRLPLPSHDDYIKMDLARFYIGILKEGGETLKYKYAIHDLQSSGRWKLSLYHYSRMTLGC
jgi:hypothetical protein